MAGEIPTYAQLTNAAQKKEFAAEWENEYSPEDRTSAVARLVVRSSGAPSAFGLQQ